MQSHPRRATEWHVGPICLRCRRAQAVVRGFGLLFLSLVTTFPKLSSPGISPTKPNPPVNKGPVKALLSPRFIARRSSLSFLLQRSRPPLPGVCVCWGGSRHCRAVPITPHPRRRTWGFFLAPRGDSSTSPYECRVHRPHAFCRREGEGAPRSALAVGKEDTNSWYVPPYHVCLAQIMSPRRAIPVEMGACVHGCWSLAGELCTGLPEMTSAAGRGVVHRTSA